MGFNPFQSHERDLTDLIVVVATLVVIAGVLAWALWG